MAENKKTINILPFDLEDITLNGNQSISGRITDIVEGLKKNFAIDYYVKNLFLVRRKNNGIDKNGESDLVVETLNEFTHTSEDGLNLGQILNEFPRLIGNYVKNNQENNNYTIVVPVKNLKSIKSSVDNYNAGLEKKFEINVLPQQINNLSVFPLELNYLSEYLELFWPQQVGKLLEGKGFSGTLIKNWYVIAPSINSGNYYRDEIDDHCSQRLPSINSLDSLFKEMKIYLTQHTFSGLLIPPDLFKEAKECLLKR